MINKIYILLNRIYLIFNQMQIDHGLLLILKVKYYVYSFVEFLFRIDRRRGRKSLQDYLRKNHEIFKLQVNLSLKYQSIFFF